MKAKNRQQQHEVKHRLALVVNFCVHITIVVFEVHLILVNIVYHINSCMIRVSSFGLSCSMKK